MFAEETLKILQDFVAGPFNGVTLRASKALNMPNDTLNRWIRGERDPGLSFIGPVLDKILWDSVPPEKIGTIEVKFPFSLDANERIEQCLHEKQELEQQIIRLKSEINILQAKCETWEKAFNAVLDKYNNSNIENEKVKKII